MPPDPKRILFVCLGNVCRSPAAEGLMRKLIDERKLNEQVQVDSAGTSCFHIGEPVDKRMHSAARRRGIELSSRSRMVNRRDFTEFDLIVAMDRNNYRELMIYVEGVGGKIRLLSDFLDDNWPREVPDPYHGCDASFDEVLDMLEAACPKLLDELLAKPG